MLFQELKLEQEHKEKELRDEQFRQEQEEKRKQEAIELQRKEHEEAQSRKREDDKEREMMELQAQTGEEVRLTGPFLDQGKIEGSQKQNNFLSAIGLRTRGKDDSDDDEDSDSDRESPKIVDTKVIPFEAMDLDQNDLDEHQVSLREEQQEQKTRVSLQENGVEEEHKKQTMQEEIENI
eukprot:TRINITY_DN26360_c1_g1_i5.p4 TRINITY_DN26360_c1_g1~~TRINITY_DN26360_c1_g1_i5.p4  ORF type:complete len:179 (-),score=35.98 TRINITY_DN26360_c1_g1_i5:339-875(-)